MLMLWLKESVSGRLFYNFIGNISYEDQAAQRCIWQNERAYCTRCSLVSASSNGFSIYSDQDYSNRTQPPFTHHPGSGRAFTDIHVRKLLVTGRNIKKISVSCARQLHEHFVQYAHAGFVKHFLATWSYKRKALRVVCEACFRSTTILYYLRE